MNLPSRKEIFNELECSLQKFSASNIHIDTITFAGNGEPTIHPDFNDIIDDTVHLRDIYFPGTSLAILTNATMVHHTRIREALNKIDLSILKLDSVNEKTIEILNCPKGRFNLQKTLEYFKLFGEKLIIQTLFVHGEYNGIFVDNSSEEEVMAWIQVVKELKPSLVMIYTIERDTPYSGLKKVVPEKLETIAKWLHEEGIKTQVSY